MIATHHDFTGDPFLVITQIVEGPDDLEQRVHRTLPDALIVVVKKLSELQGAGLNIREEMMLGGSEESANGVSSNLFLNSNRTVDVHHLVEIEIVQLNAIRTVTIVIRDCNSIGRRGSRVKRRHSIRDRD